MLGADHILKARPSLIANARGGIQYDLHLFKCADAKITEVTHAFGRNGRSMSPAAIRPDRQTRLPARTAEGPSAIPVGRPRSMICLATAPESRTPKMLISIMPSVKPKPLVGTTVSAHGEITEVHIPDVKKIGHVLHVDT